MCETNKKVQGNSEQYDIKLDVKTGGKILIQIIKTSTLGIDMNSVKYIERKAVSLFQKLKVNFMAWSISKENRIIIPLSG